VANNGKVEDKMAFIEQEERLMSSAQRLATLEARRKVADTPPNLSLVLHETLELFRRSDSERKAGLDALPKVGGADPL